MSDVQDSSQGLRVQLATTTPEREAVARLRYQVDVEELGHRFPQADHERRVLMDDMDEVASTLYVASGSELVGAVRSVRSSDAPGSHYEREYHLDELPELDPAEVSFTSRLTVAPEWRKSRAFGLLMNAVFTHLRSLGVWLDFIVCRPHLVSLYEAMGYRRCTNDLIEYEGGAGLYVPMALVADDIPYLVRVRSPFARLAHQPLSDPNHAR